MGCCQVFSLIVTFLTIGFLLGIFLSYDQNIQGLPDLWERIRDLFRKTADQAQKALKEKLVNTTNSIN